MVEQLKKEDIVIPIKLDIFSNKEYIEVSRLKEILKELDEVFGQEYGQEVWKGYEIIEKLEDRFGVLFDSQSPKSRVCDLADNRTPSQVVVSESPSERVSKNPVGVSSFCQNCGHEKEKHHFFENGKPLKKCMGVFNISFCDCSGFVEDKK